MTALTVLAVGATGSIGRHVVTEAAAAGHRVGHYRPGVAVRRPGTRSGGIARRRRRRRQHARRRRARIRSGRDLSRAGKSGWVAAGRLRLVELAETLFRVEPADGRCHDE